MNIQELDHDERIALVGLLEAVAISGRDLSEIKERALMRTLLRAGSDTFDDAVVAMFFAVFPARGGAEKHNRSQRE